MWFKRFLVYYIDGNDLLADLKSATEWIDYVQVILYSIYTFQNVSDNIVLYNSLYSILQNSDSNEEERNYFFQESFPKMLKSLLLRRHDANNFHLTVTFLESAVVVIGNYMCKYPGVSFESCYPIVLLLIYGLIYLTHYYSY